MLIDFDMLTVIILVIPLACIILVLKFKFKKSNEYILFFVLFYVYLMGIFKFTQFPIIFDDAIREKVGQNVWVNANMIPLLLKKKDIMTTILNICLTIPFGFGINFIMATSFKNTILYGVLLSVSIELTQLTIALIAGFTFRNVDINDIIFNTLGVAIGYTIFKLFILNMKKIVLDEKIKNKKIYKYILSLNE